MRVIAGSLRHRIIEGCNLETTRETQDRIREAIFNSLNFVYGRVLDLFCGSGAMAIEAYSRGANFIVLNDINIKALDVAKKNINNLNIKNYLAYNLDYKALLKLPLPPFDFIFLDPPYSFNDTFKLLDELNKSSFIKNNTKIIFEMSSKTNLNIPLNYEIIKVKKYGKKQVCFLEVRSLNE